jgi:hypothetical protein
VKVLEPVLAAWCVAALVSCDGSSARDRSPAGQTLARSQQEWRIDFQSVGPVHINVSISQAASVLGQRLEVPAPDECGSSDVRLTGAPAGIVAIVYRDTIMAIEVDSSRSATIDGLQVGSTLESIRARYDTLIDEDRSLDGDPKFTLASTDPERRFLIVFRTDGERVTSITAGRRSAAQVGECA